MAIETATQTGVENAGAETPAEKAPVVGNVARHERMAELSEASRKLRDAEIVANGGEVVDTLTDTDESVPVKDAPEETTKPQEKEVIPDEQKPVEPVEAKPSKPSPPTDELITIKVDGEERQVLKSQILDAGVRAVQKESAADKRLAEATRLLHEAQEAQKPRPLPDMDEAELVRRIRQGDDVEAIEAMRVLKGRDQATPEQIAAAVEAQVMNKIQFEKTVDWFQKEYKEIFAEPYFVQMAIAEDDRLLRSGDQRQDRERFKSIGDGLREKIREWRGGKAEVSTSTDKLEKKSTITNLPAASARLPAQEQPKPKTPSQIIEDMRARRGQAA